MNDEAKTKTQLITELGTMRRRVSELEALIVEQAPIREQLQHLIEQLPIGVQIFDTSGQCIDANEAQLRIFGLRQSEQIIGKHNLFTDPMAEKTGAQAAGRRVLAGEIVRLPDVHFDFS